MPVKPRKQDPELIVWVDSQSPDRGGWMFEEDIPFGAITCHSVGYVVRETKKNITLAAHIGQGGCMSGIMTIPKICIIKRHRLTKGKGRDRGQ